MHKRKILVDLDGVLNEYGKKPFDENNIPIMKTGAKKFLEKLSEKYELYLFTSRNLMLSAKWLIQNNIDKYFKDVTNTKIQSFLYIDDRCLCFKGDYDSIFKEINEFEVYWKKNR